MRVGVRLAVVGPISRPELREIDRQLALDATKGQFDNYHLWTAKWHGTGLLEPSASLPSDPINYQP